MFFNHRLLTGTTAFTVLLGLATFGSCAAKNKDPEKTKLTVLYQSNVNGEIEPCG